MCIYCPQWLYLLVNSLAKFYETQYIYIMNNPCFKSCYVNCWTNNCAWSWSITIEWKLLWCVLVTCLVSWPFLSVLFEHMVRHAYISCICWTIIMKVENNSIWYLSCHVDKNAVGYLDLEWGRISVTTLCHYSPATVVFFCFLCGFNCKFDSGVLMNCV